MMSLEAYLAFVAATVALALLPGPAMAMFIATSTTKGLREGFLTYVGNTAGLIILVIAAILGMEPLLSAASFWFDVIRLVGALYLVWIGIGLVRKGLAAPSGEPVQAVKSRSYFAQGLFVSLSNPKVLLFLGAFFPQFIDASKPMMMQLVVLGATFLAIAAFIDLLIVLMSGYARRWLYQKQRATHIGGGVLLVGAGLGLALSRR